MSLLLYRLIQIVSCSSPDKKWKKLFKWRKKKKMEIFFQIKLRIKGDFITSPMSLYFIWGQAVARETFFFFRRVADFFFRIRWCCLYINCIFLTCASAIKKKIYFSSRKCVCEKDVAIVRVSWKEMKWKNLNHRWSYIRITFVIINLTHAVAYEGERNKHFTYCAKWMKKKKLVAGVELRNVPSWKMTFSCFSTISSLYVCWSRANQVKIARDISWFFFL